MIESILNKNRMKKIRALLLLERSKIVEGPMTDILDISKKRDQLVQALADSRGEISLADLRGIKKESARNQQLLQSSISGIRSAQKMLASQRREATSLGTYTESGDRIDTPVVSDIGSQKR